MKAYFWKEMPLKMYASCAILNAICGKGNDLSSPGEIGEQSSNYRLV